MKNIFSNFEILPDEIILQICQYLRHAEVLYSLYNLNTRLNITITGYCYYVNLMTVPHKQFNYVATYILPCIGYHIRTFVLNAYWETMISTQLFANLFTSHLSLLCPRLEKLTVKWFTSEKLLLLIDSLENFSQLNNLNIRCLRGETTDVLLPKLFSANKSGLGIISFDKDSIALSISENSIATSYPNIQELKVNITSMNELPCLFKLVPNVRRLCVSISEWLISFELENVFIDISPLIHLIDFRLYSSNCSWTFDEITYLIQKMPSLQKLVLDFHTDDKRFLTEDNLHMILPSSCNQTDYFIRYNFFDSDCDIEDLVTSQSHHRPIAYLLDEIRNRLFIHTIPCRLYSICLPASIGKQMLSGWHYTQDVKYLYIYSATSLLEIFMIVNHFRRIRTLSIAVIKESDLLTLPSSTQPIELKLPRLEQLSITGICELSHLLNASPNLVKLNIDFNCLKVLLDNDSTYCLSLNGIRGLIITDWIDVKGDLVRRITQKFRSLYQIYIVMNDPDLIIDSFVVDILPFWQGEPRLSLSVEGLLSEEASTNIRQWIIDHSYLTAENSFAVQYRGNCLQLWL